MFSEKRSLSSLRVGKLSTGWTCHAAVEWGMLTCVGWQLTLCDPIW